MVAHVAVTAVARAGATGARAAAGVSVRAVKVGTTMARAGAQAGRATAAGARAGGKAASTGARSGGGAGRHGRGLRSVRPGGAPRPPRGPARTSPEAGEGGGQPADASASADVAPQVTSARRALRTAGQVARTARHALRPLRLARNLRRLTARAKDDKKRQVNRARRIVVIVLLLFFVMFAASFATVGGVGNPPQQQSSFDADLTGLPFAALFEATAALGIDPRLVAAVAWTESAFAPDVVSCERASDAGARGIMQFMPATARSMNIDPCDPAEAIPAGARYLLAQYERFDTWELALAAYNAGPGAVEEHGGIPPYAETQAYVPKVMAKWEEYKQRFPGEDLGGGAGSAGPGQPMGSTERYTERANTPRMQRLLDAVVPEFGRGHGIGCYRSSGDGEHPKGRACDFIMSEPLNTMPTSEYLDHGWRMARWLVDNAEEYGVYYVIWQEKIWSSSYPDQGWRPYTRYPDGNLQQNHYDHIHVSVR